MVLTRFRSPRSILFAIAFSTVLFGAADLHAGKKPADKPNESPNGISSAPAAARPEIPDLEFITRLRQEEYNHSQVMDIISHLTDDIGPRLTGSPNMRKANDWTRDEFARWGLANAHLESWGPFGRGWAYQLCEVRMTAPDYMQFVALPEAWTPGTNGPLHGEVVHVTAASAADLEKYRGKLAGKIVLFGEARLPEPSDRPLFNRVDAADLDRLALFEPPGDPHARRT